MFLQCSHVNFSDVILILLLRFVYKDYKQVFLGYCGDSDTRGPQPYVCMIKDRPGSACSPVTIQWPPTNHACPRSASIRDSQDFEAGCFQPRARLAAQSFGRAALANSLTPCLVMGLSQKMDRHDLDGQLLWIFWPSGTSHI